MKTVVDELAPLKGYDGIPGITKVEEEPAAAAAATNAKRRPIVAGAVSICIAATLVFVGCNFMQRSSIPAGTPGKEGGEPQQHLIVAAANDDETTTGTTKTTEGDGDSSRRWSSWWSGSGK